MVGGRGESGEPLSQRGSYVRRSETGSGKIGSHLRMWGSAGHGEQSKSGSSQWPEIFFGDEIGVWHCTSKLIIPTTASSLVLTTNDIRKTHRRHTNSGV